MCTIFSICKFNRFISANCCRKLVNKQLHTAVPEAIHLSSGRCVMCRLISLLWSGSSEPRMQLVVMAAVLVMTRARQDCRFPCLPTHTTISVKSCVRTESINTTMCAGQCFQQVSEHGGCSMELSLNDTLTLTLAR